jgi:hypothetical protein
MLWNEEVKVTCEMVDIGQKLGEAKVKWTHYKKT